MEKKETEEEKVEAKRNFLIHICSAANEIYTAIELLGQDATKSETYRKLARCYIELYTLAMEDE